MIKLDLRDKLDKENPPAHIIIITENFHKIT